MRKPIAIGVMAGLVAVILGCQKRDETGEDRRAWERGTAHAGAPAAEAPITEAPFTEAPAAEPPAARRTPEPHAQAAPIRRLEHGSTSVDELMTKLLATLAVHDLTGLERLRVTEAEHTDLLWPEFPAKDHNVEPTFAWDMLDSRSHIGVGRAIGDWGGQELTLMGVEFTRETERYRSFVLHRGTLVHARTATGAMVDLTFCGSVLELDGQFKLLSFRD